MPQVLLLDRAQRARHRPRQCYPAPSRHRPFPRRAGSRSRPLSVRRCPKTCRPRHRNSNHHPDHYLHWYRHRSRCFHRSRCLKDHQRAGHQCSILWLPAMRRPNWRRQRGHRSLQEHLGRLFQGPGRPLLRMRRLVRWRSNHRRRSRLRPIR
jgi:hypothetical protein